MNTLPFKIPAEAVGGAFADVVLDKSNLGFNPADTFSSVQVSCSGLDGGDFALDFLPQRTPSFISYISGALETDAILLDRSFAFEAVKVSFNNLGGDAAPVVYATFIKRSF